MAAHRISPIESHLDAFEKTLGTKTDKHRKLTMARIKKVISGCGFSTLGDMDGDAVDGFMLEWHDDDDFGARTFNHYVQAISQFGNWCLQKKRLMVNPFLGLTRLNAEADIRHKRRALAQDEFVMLIESARKSDEMIQCYDGPTRASIYLTSFFTGLRRKEIASLTPRSFRLTQDPPTVVVDAACSKHRREDTLPLHADFVALLREWLEGLESNQALFPKLAKRRTWLMVKKDLERVGIPYKTDDGVADFHAVGRHTYITELLRNKVTLPEAMELARHTDAKMTMKYAHIGIHDQGRALSALPNPQLASESDALDSVPVDRQNDTWQRLGSAPGVSDSHFVSAGGANVQEEGQGQKRQNPCDDRGFDVDCQQESPNGSDDSEWRRRESNPRPAIFPNKLLRV